METRTEEQTRDAQVARLREAYRVAFDRAFDPALSTAERERARKRARATWARYKRLIQARDQQARCR